MRNTGKFVQGLGKIAFVDKDCNLLTPDPPARFCKYKFYLNWCNLYNYPGDQVYYRKLVLLAPSV
jgi:hypothetical protein